jgi:hypothetical protein
MSSIYIFNSIIIWCPNAKTHAETIKKVQKRFLRLLYLRERGFYPFIFPTAFFLGCWGATLSLYLGKHFFKLIRAGMDNPTILTEIGFWVPERPRPSRSRPLFIPVRARTRVLSDAPLTRAISLLNRL